jgi:hypothetical protein
MSAAPLKLCSRKVKLLNAYYRSTMLLAALTDELAKISDSDTAEFQSVLTSVTSARESGAAARQALESHTRAHGCGTGVCEFDQPSNTSQDQTPATFPPV